MNSARPVRTSEWVAEPSTGEFDALRELIRRRTGIYLNSSKRALIHSRLAKRIREIGLGSFGQYLKVIRGSEAEAEQMVDRITTNETRFFREPMHFQCLKDTIVPSWLEQARRGARSRAVRVWSAGCSTGEEPHSVAMMLLDLLPEHDGWTVEVLATDISRRVLAIARSATWPIERMADVPERFVKRFMLRGVGSQAGKVRAAPELRSVVRVESLNLNDELYAVRGPFDVILCRNVLIYFDGDQKRRVVERLASRLAPGGYLFVGHAESVHDVPGLGCVLPTVYSNRPRDLQHTRRAQ